MLSQIIWIGWNPEPSCRFTNDRPAFESRFVRTQPLIVTSVSSGCFPASRSAMGRCGMVLAFSVCDGK